MAPAPYKLSRRQRITQKLERMRDPVVKAVEDAARAAEKAAKEAERAAERAREASSLAQMAATAHVRRAEEEADAALLAQIEGGHVAPQPVQRTASQEARIEAEYGAAAQRNAVHGGINKLWHGQ
jgi:membrane protein involved in colicin uptake